MSLLPDNRDLAARARADLRLGLPVVISDADGDALVASAETVPPERLTAMQALGETVLAITARRAETLKARAYDGDMARIVLASDTPAATIAALADPSLDLRHPMKGPFETLRGGEVAAHRAALALLKSAQLLPAAVVVRVDKAPDGDLTRLRSDTLMQTLAAPLVLHSVASARVPLAVSQAGRVHVFRPEDGGEEHYAVEIGRPDRAHPVLTRLHSACFTGDLMGSLKCDCGPQLRAALTQIGDEGAGVLLYLNQEGRGIGLANKMRAYALQDQGFDTVEANHRLGFEDDERDFRIGSDILRRMGFKSVRLMTNNPAKIAMMQARGLQVAEHVPLRVGETRENRDYLATKAAKSGHLL